ncbi:MAG: response regulator, partial [Telluria sp.]
VAVEHEPQRALDKAAEFCPDACLLDIGLPGMDGYELARRLREGEQTASATLIALTGYGNKYGRESTVSAGFDFYFVKPAKTTELIAVLAGIQPAQLPPARASLRA